MYHSWEALHRVILEGADDEDDSCFAGVGRVFPLSYENGILTVAAPAEMCHGRAESFFRFLPLAFGDPALREIKLELLDQQIFEKLAEIREARLKRDASTTVRNVSAEEGGATELTVEFFESWLQFESNHHPILAIQCSDWRSAIRFLTGLLQEEGFTVRGGNLRIITTADIERGDSLFDAEGPPSNVLVLSGLSAQEVNDTAGAESLRVLDARRKIGQTTILIDSSELPWKHQNSARMRLLEASTIEAEWRKQADGSSRPERLKSDSDVEMILVIASVVAKRFDVPLESLRNRHADQSGLTARQAAFYMARKWGNFDFGTIGSVLGGRKYVSTAQAYRRVADRRLADAEFDRKLNAIEVELTQLADLKA